ncbi:MAG: PilZ domain-containing protein [Gemmataceae bacterium]|nr:PilZ domain-containing protein [Gemmataceae bacterium]
MNRLLDEPRAADRRAHPRYQPTFGTVCRVRRTPPVAGQGLVWDISVGGIGILVGSPPEPGEELAGELETQGATQPVTLKVAHVRRLTTGDYFVGARFAAPLSQDQMAPFVTPHVIGGRG